MITNEAIQEIIEKADIVEVVSDYVPLEKVGSNYRGLCPFHDDHSPSFYVSPTKRIASCMTCKEGGNAITIVQKMDRISFDEACKKVADRYGIKVNIKTTNKDLPNNQKYYEITNFSTKFYEYYLNNSENGKKALEYLHKRRLNDETISMFHIGLAPHEKDSLYKTLRDKKFLELDMLDCGVVKKADDYYDIFNNRIIFPIIDIDNNTVGFSGRIFNGETNSPKYVNSGENTIFNKGQVLYNLNNALFDIRRKKRMIIMEGQMDVISSFNAGVRETVCSMGTALTASHAKLIKKYVTDVILCFDGDEAGQHATARAIDILANEGINVSILILPEGLDPDEYTLKYGNEKFKELFETQTVDVWTFRYLYAKSQRNLSNMTDKEAFKLEIFKFIMKTKSQTFAETYLNMLSKDLNVTVDALSFDYSNYYKQLNRIKSVEKAPQIKKSNTIKNGPLDAYKILLYHMLDGYKTALLIRQELNRIEAMEREYIIAFSDDVIECPVIALIYKKYKLKDDDDFITSCINYEGLLLGKYYPENSEMDLDYFENAYLKEDLKEFYDNLKEIIVSTKNSEKEISECLITLRTFVIKMGLDYLVDRKSEYSNQNQFDRVNEMFMIQARFKREIEELKNKK